MPSDGAAAQGELPGTYVFDGRRSRQGYRLNRLAMSLTDPANRKAFGADEDAYMASMELSPEEREMVRRRDWQAMVRSGGNIYLLLKIAGTLGQTLLQMGAQMRGETLEQFMATRPGAKGGR
jgi:protocatechuate 4,5-dioxygenase, alpha chain